MKVQSPIIKDLVLAGGGHSHVTVLKKFGMKPLAGVRITVICRDAHTPYSGMLPGLIAGHYQFDDTHIDLQRLSRFAGARFYHDEITGLDPEGKRVFCANRPAVSYDLLSVNVGSTPDASLTPGAEGNVVGVKPIDRFYVHWEALRARLLDRSEPTRIGVVGGGAGGIELILAVQFRLRRDFAEQGRSAGHLQFHLYSDQHRLLHTHNESASARFERVLAERGVSIHLGHKVTRVAAGELGFENGETSRLDEILWVTWAGAAPWIRASGLAVDSGGFLQVDERLRSVSHETVFGAGDVASMLDHPRPKSGVFAVRQGPPLYRNLRNTLLHKPLVKYVPQQHFLGLISTGDKYAVASRGRWALEGAYLWKLKDWIDRRFMHRFSELPPMNEQREAAVAVGLADESTKAEMSAASMRCGGCGAKVGALVVNRVLASLTPDRRDDILVGLDAPDDAAVIVVPPGKLMVHTVDMFRPFMDDPYLFAKVAANHALGDIYAMGAKPQSALVIATLPYAPEHKTEDQLAQLMTGASEVLAAEETALVGGHTSEGCELYRLGFSVNGLIERQRMLRKAGMCPGDRLILTKPLGTGILFAADMRHQAKGRWIDAALEVMLQSSRAAAQCLQRNGATACTDVTGFGLLGHLLEMNRTAHKNAEVELSALPVMDGASELAANGVLSSLHPQNQRLQSAIEERQRVASDPRYAILFDPQTAGGLLASVPSRSVDSCVRELRGLGYVRASIIGRVLSASGGAESIKIVG